MPAHYGSSLIASKAVYGVTELGILGSVIRATTATGVNGSGLLYNEWDNSSDDTKLFRVVILGGAPTGAFFYEDGSFYVPAGVADGNYTVSQEVYIDGVSIGTVNATIAIGNVTLVIKDSAQSYIIISAVSKTSSQVYSILSSIPGPPPPAPSIPVSGFTKVALTQTGQLVILLM